MRGTSNNKKKKRPRRQEREGQGHKKRSLPPPHPTQEETLVSPMPTPPSHPLREGRETGTQAAARSPPAPRGAMAWCQLAGGEARTDGRNLPPPPPWRGHAARAGGVGGERSGGTEMVEGEGWKTAPKQPGETHPNARNFLSIIPPPSPHPSPPPLSAGTCPPTRWAGVTTAGEVVGTK